MIDVMTKNREIGLRKEDYEGYTVTYPNGVTVPFWEALTQVIGEPWAETIIIKENSIISAGDLDKHRFTSFLDSIVLNDSSSEDGSVKS